MRKLWRYDSLARLPRPGYRGKILLISLAGTTVPLLAILVLCARSAAVGGTVPSTAIGVGAAATLIGAAATLFVLNRLLRPILLLSRGLRAYRLKRDMPDLALGLTGEIGTLMADTARTLGDLESAISERSGYDGVTGLPNRDRLLYALTGLLPANRRAAVCVVRLGDYDRLAASVGQPAADEALRCVADRLRSAVPPEACPARLEGGILAWLVVPGEAEVEPGSRVEGVLAELRRDMRRDGRIVVPDIKAGVSLYPEDAPTAAALLDNALTALTMSAAPGQPSTAYFSIAAREAARRRFMTEQELRRALERDELMMHLQPIVDVRLGRAVGAEALVRWQHPERGLLPPSQFIPVAEASGLIEPIGSWALEVGCRQLRQWMSQGRDDLTLALNVTARQFHDTNLARLIDSALHRHGVPAHRLEIDLTETAAMRDRAHTREIIGRLRELGVRVAIDDFGTGCSSMSYLRDLPFDKLKIDREFVDRVDRRPACQAICRSLIALGRGLGIAVLAEGAEREEEVRFLNENGCTLFQGYYFARPMSAEAFGPAIDRLMPEGSHDGAGGLSVLAARERVPA